MSESPDRLELPGAQILERGVEDLEQGRESIAALLVLIARPRLESLGIRVPARPWEETPCAELRLYRLLVDRHGRDGYGQYNAWIRRLVSLEHALEKQAWAARRSAAG